MLVLRVHELPQGPVPDQIQVSAAGIRLQVSAAADADSIEMINTVLNKYFISPPDCFPVFPLLLRPGSGLNCRCAGVHCSGYQLSC